MEVVIKNLIYKNKDFILNIEGQHFKDGAIYGILGANGSGKSTLLKIIAGLITDFKGEVEYLCDNKKIISPKSSISILSQKPYLFNYTVEENIKMSKRWANSQMDFKYIVDILELDELLKRNANSLSGGEMQRVALARVLSQDLDLILLDEPTASIDPKNTRIIEEAIKKSKKEDRCIVVITHNIYQALRICDKIIFMNRGIILEEVDIQNTSQSEILNEYLLHTSS